jgi:hypothetical protein
MDDDKIYEMVAWTGTHYGRGHAPSGPEVVAGVIAAWGAASNNGERAAVLVTDEDAGFIAADAEGIDDAEAAGFWLASDQPVRTAAEAVRAWWENYGGVDTGEDVPDWLPVVRLWHPDAEWLGE